MVSSWLQYTYFNRSNNDTDINFDILSVILSLGGVQGLQRQRGWSIWSDIKTGSFWEKLMWDKVLIFAAATPLSQEWSDQHRDKKKKITFTQPYKEGHMSEEDYCEWQDQMLDLFHSLLPNTTVSCWWSESCSTQGAHHTQAVITKTIIVITQDLAQKIAQYSKGSLFKQQTSLKARLQLFRYKQLLCNH